MVLIASPVKASASEPFPAPHGSLGLTSVHGLLTVMPWRLPAKTVSWAFEILKWMVFHEYSPLHAIRPKRIGANVKVDTTAKHDTRCPQPKLDQASNRHCPQAAGIISARAVH
jgi:hypothetical protein